MRIKEQETCLTLQEHDDDDDDDDEIRILSFVLRKEVFMSVSLAFCVDMKWDFKEDDFNYDYSQMNSYDHLDLRKAGSYVTRSLRSFAICRSDVVSVG